MSITAPTIYTTHSLGGRTETAGTRIRLLVPPAPPQAYSTIKAAATYFTRISSLSYVSAGTQHQINFLRVIGSTTMASAAPASQAVINLTADPGNPVYGPVSTVTASLPTNAIAASDVVGWLHADGTYKFGVVSSVASLAITLTANVPTGGIDAAAPVWLFGVAGDSDPMTALPHPYLRPPVSVRTEYKDEYGLVASLRAYEPIVVDVDNATAAGYLENVVAIYTNR